MTIHFCVVKCNSRNSNVRSSKPTPLRTDIRFVPSYITPHRRWCTLGDVNVDAALSELCGPNDATDGRPLYGIDVSYTAKLRKQTKKASVIKICSNRDQFGFAASCQRSSLSTSQQNNNSHVITESLKQYFSLNQLYVCSFF